MKIEYFDTMLTDMTPTAGQLYGSQIPGMTMNMNLNKAAVSKKH